MKIRKGNTDGKETPEDNAKERNKIKLRRGVRGRWREKSKLDENNRTEW